MQLGSVGSLPGYVSTAQVSRPEAVERGPDRDNDGDEGTRSSAPSASPPAASGRGGAIDILA